MQGKALSALIKEEKDKMGKLSEIAIKFSLDVEAG